MRWQGWSGRDYLKGQPGGGGVTPNTKQLKTLKSKLAMLPFLSFFKRMLPKWVKNR